MLHLASTLVLILVAAGLWVRKANPQLHQRFMIAAFTSDLLLVLYIEFSRHAVEKVVSHVHPMIWFHAAVSLSVLCCYVVMIMLGRPMLAGKFQTRSLHRALGMTFVVLRSLNYVTSYMLT